MANPIMQPPKPNITALFNQFMQNPMQMLMKSKLNIPQNIQNDPNAIIQHLMSTGQMSQEQYNNARSMASQLFPNNK